MSERAPQIPDPLRRTIALGATCLAAFGINMPAQAITLKAASGTSETFVESTQDIADSSLMPTPLGRFTIAQEDCGSGDIGARKGCIYYASKLIKIRPDIKGKDLKLSELHEIGHAVDQSLVTSKAKAIGQQPDLINGITSFRLNLLYKSGKAKTFDQAAYIIKHGPEYDESGNPLNAEQQKYWMSEYAAVVYSACAGMANKLKPNVSANLGFFNTGVTLRAKAYNKTCDFIKRYLSADRQHFESGVHH